MFKKKKEKEKPTSTQHICECGNKKFLLIGELHFDWNGSWMPDDAWNFKCTECGIIYDKHGSEIGD